jgi:ligand-binding sensor domain-containing protein
LYLDAHNRLWVFYENAFFDLFDPRSFRVKRLNSMPELRPLLAHYPFSFFSIDGHGNFWVASEKGELITKLATR